LNDVPQATGASTGATVTDIPRRSPLSASAFNAAKAAAAVGNGAATGAAPIDVPQQSSKAGGVLTPGASLTFDGNNQVGCASPGNRQWVPADMALAVGLNFVVQANNACINVFTKNTGLGIAGYPKDLYTFLGVTPNCGTNPICGGFLADPRAIYDWVNNRFLMVLMEYDSLSGSPRGSYWLLVSQTDDPTQGWFKYHLFTGSTNNNACPDYPRIGQDKQAIYLAANLFGACQTFVGEEWLVIGKANALAGGISGWDITNIHNPDGSLSFTSQPANVFSLFDNPRAEFFTNSDFCGTQCGGTRGTKLTVFALSNPLSPSSGPTITAVDTPVANHYTFPPDANQPGGSHNIDTVDARITGEVTYSAGSLYAALTTRSATNNPAVIMYKINPALNDGAALCDTGSFHCANITAAPIINEICFACGGFTDSTAGAYFPTVQPDTEGNWTLVYNFSGNGTFGSTAYLSNRVTKLKGTLHDSGFFARVGSAFWSNFRWGDYTAVAPDFGPKQGQMWFSGMFTRSDGKWGTVIGRNAYNFAGFLP
jgi:hypothetical protein